MADDSKEVAMVDKGETPITWQDLRAIVCLAVVVIVPFCMGRYVFPKHQTIICTYSYSAE